MKQGLTERGVTLHWAASEFWSGDLGLTLITISLVMLIFVVTPLREAGVTGRAFFDVAVMLLMLFGALSIKQSRLVTVLVISFVLTTAAVLAAGRFHPTPALHQIGSVLATITLLLYVRIVLGVMFSGSPMTWSRIQGGVSAYLLLGMAWAPAYQTLEQFRPGSFRFVAAPQNFDQLIAKLTYFSFTTPTTVGGEITPASPVARSLAIAEAMLGQLFPAIFIWALVAMAVQSRSQPKL